MTPSLRTETLDLVFRDPFRIARTEDPEGARVVLVELALDTVAGIGECFPVPYYGETVRRKRLAGERAPIRTCKH